MDKLLTVPQAAEYLQIHPQTLYKKREIPRKKIAGAIRFKESELNKYLEQSTISPPIPPISSELQRLTRYAKLNQKGGNSAVSKKKQRWNYGHGFGGIYIRRTSKGEEKYYIWLYDENRKRQRKVVKEAVNKEQAELALYSEIQKVFDRKYGNVRAEKKAVFSDFAKEYLETYAKPRKRSWQSDAKYLKTHLIPFFGQMDLSEISPLHVQSFIAKKIEAGIGKSSINRYLQIMRSMLNIGKEYGYAIAENPVKQKLLFNEAGFRRTRILTQEEERRLIKESAPHLKAIIQFALKTGCRLQEILGLQTNDLDFKNATIAIRPEINKSGKRDIIPISSDVRNLLKGLIANNNGSRYVFNYFDHSKGNFVPVKSVSVAFRNACRRAKISDLQFRDLRRSFSSRLHELQADPLLIQRLLRHSSFKISEEVYIQSSMESMKDAIEKLCQKSI